MWPYILLARLAKRSGGGTVYRGHATAPCRRDTLTVNCRGVRLKESSTFSFSEIQRSELSFESADSNVDVVAYANVVVESSPESRATTKSE
jgi:hypothetical protein